MPMFEKKEDIFELIDKFEKSTLTEIDIDVADVIMISMKKQSAVPPVPVPVQGVQNSHINHANQSNVTTVPPQQQSMFTEMVANNIATIANLANTMNTAVDSTNIEAKDGKIMTAPLIGVYYAAPSPDSEPFVEIGKKVSKGSILCIIEAMKVMNDIESDYSGEIAEIFVKNGETVEYGQPLFRII